MKFQANITVSSLSKVYVNLMPNIIMKFLENNIFLYDKKYGLDGLMNGLMNMPC